MEEDIKILEDLIQHIRFNEPLHYEIGLYIQALEHLIKGYKELEERQIAKNEQIRNGQPVIANTRLTVLDVLYLMTKFINTHEEEFRKDIVNISINQIISAIDYFIDNSIQVYLIEEKLKKEKSQNITVGGRKNGKTLEYGKKLGRIEILEELLEKRK